MSVRRILLHKKLCDILGTQYVYFQPPESVKMNYPAIVYGLDAIQNTDADDRVYLSRRKYTVTVIDRDPDSVFVGKVATLPTCRYNRHYKKDNLNHDVFSLYF